MRATAAGVHQMTKVCHHCIPLYLFIGSKNTAVQSAVPAAHQRILVHDNCLQFSNLVITAPTVDTIRRKVIISVYGKN